MVLRHNKRRGSPITLVPRGARFGGRPFCLPMPSDRPPFMSLTPGAEIGVDCLRMRAIFAIKEALCVERLHGELNDIQIQNATP